MISSYMFSKILNKRVTTVALLFKSTELDFCIPTKHVFSEVDEILLFISSTNSLYSDVVVDSSDSL